MSNLEKYKKTYYYEELQKNYNLNEFGTWKVEGEDTNPDMGGCHSNPHIAYVEGRLIDVINWAVEQPTFWQWGSGGKIERVEILDMDSIMQAVENKRALLELMERAIEKIDNMTDAEIEEALENAEDTLGRAIRGE